MKLLMKTLVATALMAAVVGTAQAAVMEEASTSFAETSTASSSSFPIELKAASNSILLLGATRAFGASDITSVDLSNTDGSFSGVNLVADAGVNTTYEIWAIDLGSASAGTATITANWDASKEADYFAVQLSNATLDGVVTGFDEGNDIDPSVELTGLTAGSYAFAVGSHTKTASAAVPLTGITDRGYGVDGGGNMEYAFGAEVLAGSDITVEYNPGTSGKQKGDGLGVVAIAPIPEPASLALLALGGLVMVSVP